MSHPRPTPRPAREPSHAGELRRVAAKNAHQLRQSFHQQAMARPNALAWRRLEDQVADLLERRHNDALSGEPMVPSLAELDQHLLHFVGFALKRDDPSGRRWAAFWPECLIRSGVRRTMAASSG